MTSHATPLELVPESQLPKVEALDRPPLHGPSDLFPHFTIRGVDSVLAGYNPGSDLGRLPIKVAAVNWMEGGIQPKARQTIAEREAGGDIPPIHRRIQALNLQKALLNGIHGAIDFTARKGFSVLQSTYVLGDYIEQKDQQLRDGYSAVMASDARLYYALENGGELRLPGPAEEMILDIGDEKERLAGNVEDARLTMERLDFEWLSAVSILEIIRAESRRHDV